MRNLKMLTARNRAESHEDTEVRAQSTEMRCPPRARAWAMGIIVTGREWTAIDGWTRGKSGIHKAQAASSRAVVARNPNLPYNLVSQTWGLGKAIN